jgi:HEPN domain-containing protein
MKKATKDWLLAAQDDLKSIELLIIHPELTNIVAFHAQQAIEKSLKAAMEEYDIIFIKTHNLKTLLSLIKIDICFNQNIISELDQLYIDSRYPGDMGLMPEGKPTQEDASNYYKEAECIYEEILKIVAK